MRRCLLFLILILVPLISYNITPILAQEENDRLEIQKVIQSLFENSFANDLESSMKDISHNYSDSVDDKPLDYAQFKSIQEKMLNAMSKKYVNYSFSDLKIDKLDIQGNEATLEIEFTWNGFNLDAARKENGIQKRFIALEKENGLWKITKMRKLAVF